MVFAEDIVAAVRADARAAVEPPAIRTSHFRGIVTGISAKKSGTSIFLCDIECALHAHVTTTVPIITATVGG